jgi:hypothetical protein
LLNLKTSLEKRVRVKETSDCRVNNPIGVVLRVKEIKQKEAEEEMPTYITIILVVFTMVMAFIFGNMLYEFIFTEFGILFCLKSLYYKLLPAIWKFLILGPI